MELTLSIKPGSTGTVLVKYEESVSHTFEMSDLPALPKGGALPKKLSDIGVKLYAALFPPRSLAERLLTSEMKKEPEQRRLLLALGSAGLESVLWEFLRGEQGLLAASLCLLRGVASGERRALPDLSRSSLRVFAAFAEEDEAGWQRMQEAFAANPGALERLSPPSVDELRRAVTGLSGCGLHYRGRAAQAEGQIALSFTREDGAAQPIRPRDLLSRLGDALFLAALDGPAGSAVELNNLAAALMRQGLPYALAMRFDPPAGAAEEFWAAFYAALIAGAPPEAAVLRARARLGEIAPDLAGLPVLYSALGEPAPGLALHSAKPAAAAVEAPPAEAQLAPPPASQSILPPVEVSLPSAPPVIEPPAPQLPPADQPRATLPVHMDKEQLRAVVVNTIAVMTVAPEKRGQWAQSARQAYQQSLLSDFTAEIELFSAILAVLDGEQPNLPADNPYAEALKAILEGITSAGAAGQQVEIPEAVGEAVRELLQASSLDQLEKVLRKRRNELLSQEAELLLGALIQESGQSAPREAMEALSMMIAVLRDARQNGVDAAVQHLRQADQQAREKMAAAESFQPPEEEAWDGPIPPGFADRCVAGLLGKRAEREALFNYLEALPLRDPGLSALVKVVKLAILGSNPRKLGGELSGVFAETWQEIVGRVG